MNKALKEVEKATKKGAKLISLNLLSITKKASIEIAPNITQEKVIYRDSDNGVTFVDAIEVAVLTPSNSSEGMPTTQLRVKLVDGSNRKFHNKPLSATPIGPDATEIHDCIFCTEFSDDGKEIGLGFKIPNSSTDKHESMIFDEIYFVTDPGNGKSQKKYLKVDPAVIIIRG